MKHRKFNEAKRKYREFLIIRGSDVTLVDTTINKINTVFRLTDKDPFRLTADDAISIYSRVYEMPKYLCQNKVLKGINGKELIDKAKALDLDTISIATAEKYLGAVNVFFEWSVSLGLLNSNCFSNLNPKKNKEKADKQRKAFTESQIAMFFNSSILSKNEISDFGWILIIALELGMRQNEIAQLHRDDVINVDGIWCIYINENHPMQSVKNEHSVRYLPLTKSLLRLNFIEFAKSKDGMIFESLTYCKKNKFSRKISEHYSQLSRSLFNDEKLTFHSIRHYFSDSLKNKNLPEDIVAELKGHKHCRETFGRYGKERPLKYKRKILNKNSSSVVWKFAMSFYVRNKLARLMVL